MTRQQKEILEVSKALDEVPERVEGTGGTEEKEALRRWSSSPLWVRNDSDVSVLASRALSRLTRDLRVHLRSAGSANEKAMSALAARADWSAVRRSGSRAEWGAKCLSVVATIAVSWLDSGGKSPTAAMDIVLSLEED